MREAGIIVRAEKSHPSGKATFTDGKRRPPPEKTPSFPETRLSHGNAATDAGLETGQAGSKLHFGEPSLRRC